MFLFPPLYMYVCDACRYVGVWFLYIHTEDQTGHWISSSIALCLIALRQGILLSQARLARELSVSTYHYPPMLGL